MLVEARQYQVEAVASIWDYFKTKRGNPLVAMPTGTGKSVVIANFLESIFRSFPHQKVLVSTHVKELVDQNYKKLLDVWPGAPAGIYSAGLKRRDTQSKILFAGIASIIKIAKQLGKVNLLIIDEAHLVSPNEESMYRKLIAILMAVNPMLKIIGLTATPWRLGVGKIVENGGIFTDICFDITGLSAFNRLIREGFIAPLIAPANIFRMDVSGVHKLGGEFKPGELQLAVDKEVVTRRALTETLARGADRNHWLIFASGVEHAEHIADMLTEMGVECRAVHSEMSDAERDRNIKDFKSGKLRAIVNNNVLTTGFDYPAIDLIVMLRPTASTVLWVQMLGRGTRPSLATGKENCLVLDFAGNTGRLGPINDPVIPRKKGEGTGEAPVRICEECDMYNHASARFCGGEPFKTAEGCGHPFTFTTKLKSTASTHVVVKDDLPIVTEFEVKQVTYAVHNKMGKPPSLRVSYFTPFNKFTEFIHFEIPGWGERKARAWWGERSGSPAPATTAEAEQQASTLRVPIRVKVWVNKPYPEVMSVEFEKATI